MTARPWMPFYVSDYLSDTLDLDADQHGVYLVLLMIAWRRPDGVLPGDFNILRRMLVGCMADMHGNRFNRLVPPILARFFSLGSDGNYHQNRLEKELEKSRKFSRKQKENSEKRWSESSKINDLPNATALPARVLQSHTQHRRKKDAPSGALGFSERDCRTAELDLLTEAVNGEHADLPDGSKAELERQLFRRGKQVLGPDTGGLIKKLLNAKQGVVAHAQAAIEMASTKENPREYIGAIIRGQVSPDAEQMKRVEEFHRERKTAVVFATDVPGGIPGIR